MPMAKEYSALKLSNQEITLQRPAHPILSNAQNTANFFGVRNGNFQTLSNKHDNSRLMPGESFMLQLAIIETNFLKAIEENLFKGKPLEELETTNNPNNPRSLVSTPNKQATA